MSDTYNLFQQGRTHLREGMAAQATVPLEKAKRREPEKASIREALGIAYFRIHRYDAAESEFRKMLELAPADDYAHYALGRCLEKQGRETEAQGHYKLASSLRPASKHYSSRIRTLGEVQVFLRNAARRPRRQSRHGLQVGIASDALARIRDVAQPAVRAVVQRVSRARVVVRGKTVGAIGPGLCVLLGVADDDADDDAERLAAKIAQLRIFENEDGKFDRSLLDVRGEALVVSQFTLIADTAKGNRPSFSHAAPPEQAERVYALFCEALRGSDLRVETGVFGARMQLELVNDGPVTIVLDVQRAGSRVDVERSDP